MTDPRQQDAPPPSPWWSRPGDDPWGSSGSDQPAYGGYLGATADSTGGGGTATATQLEDPWSRPSTQATFPSGAQAWSSGPVDTAGRPAGERRGGRRGLVALLATALIAGGVGGAVGSALTDRQEVVTDRDASLGAPATGNARIDRAPESVAGIAATLMKSTVSIGVKTRSESGTGSGVVIRSDGYIITNNHVVAPAADGGDITVQFDDGQPDLPATIVGRDPLTDLAVLKVRSDRDLPAAALGRSSALVVGDPVIAIGSPLGLSGTVTTGIVSALNRTVRTPSEDGQTSRPLYNAIQTDAAINPGNSGGALVNGKGEVVGINSAIATLGSSSPFGGGQGGSIGVGFSIPIDEARSVAEEIIKTGAATHPSIGVTAETTPAGADRTGAIVRKVTPGLGAQQSGLRPGDLITKVDDTDVASVDELIVALREKRVGDTVTLTYSRGGRDTTSDVLLQDLPLED